MWGSAQQENCRDMVAQSHSQLSPQAEASLTSLVGVHNSIIQRAC